MVVRSRKRAREAEAAASSSRTDLDVDTLAQEETILLKSGYPQPERMVRYFADGTFTDATLLLGGRSFRVHRVVLAAVSDYLNARLAGDWADRTGPLEVLTDIPGDVASAVLDAVYKGECTITAALLPAVLQAAHYLQILPLLNAAALSVEERLLPANCMGAWRTAERYGLQMLEAAALKVALANFRVVLTTDEFLMMPHNFVLALLSSDRLDEREEERVFDTAVRWLAAQQRPTTDEIGALFSACRCLHYSSPRAACVLT